MVRMISLVERRAREAKRKAIFWCGFWWGVGSIVLTGLLMLGVLAVIIMTVD